MAASSNLADDFAAAEALALQPAASATELSNNLRKVYETFYNLDLARYDVAKVRTSAPLLMQAVFNLRMQLRERIAEWHRQERMPREVQKALRDIFRVTRYAGDMLGELAIGHERLGEDALTYRAFTGPHLNTLLHPSRGVGGDVTFQSGDVVLMRGRRHNSAAIARIGDVDSQFSHLAMVYIDRHDRPWIVESLIEDGAVINPLEEVLREGIGRAVLFRHKDTELALRAADFIHDHVHWSRSGWFRRILYDFTMELEGYERLFCSKLVRQAFDAASNGRVKLSTFTTRLDMKNPDFFDRIGVTAKETFAPGDMELEPDFDVVAEWQDYRVTASLRAQDMIMDKFFAWMGEANYAFKEDFATRLIAVLGRMSSYLSDEAKALIADVVPKVPVNMTRKTIATIAMLHRTAQPVLRALEELDQQCIRETGRGLHPREILQHLEEIRRTSNGRIGYLCAPSS